MYRYLDRQNEPVCQRTKHPQALWTGMRDKSRFSKIGILKHEFIGLSECLTLLVTCLQKILRSAVLFKSRAVLLCSRSYKTSDLFSDFFWCSRWQDTFLGRGQTYGHFCRRLASKPLPTNAISLFSFAVFDCLCTLLDNPRRNSDRMHQIPSVFCMGQLGSREGLSLVISLNT